MTQNTSEKDYLDYCTYCGAKLSTEILSILEKSMNPVYCEFCGAEIKKVEYADIPKSLALGSENTSDLAVFNTNDSKSTLSPLGEIYFDPDFSKTFKDNLMIVIARIIYYNMNKFYDIEDLKNSDIELSESTLNEIADTLEPLTNKRIRINFYGKLKDISIKKFEKLLKKLQLKIQSDQKYHEKFIVYLRWLISIVFKLITERWDARILPSFENTILKDLKSYGFNSYSEQFEYDELIEKFLHYTHEIKFIKNLIKKFNEQGLWIKNFCPTQTFIDYLKEKLTQLEEGFKNNVSNNAKTQTELISAYLTIITKIKEKDALLKAIKNLISRNKGKYNAYDIQKWLLITDAAARNQLKRMFPKEKYQEYVRTQTHVTIETIEEIAERKRGKFHTKNIKTAKSKIHLECAEGHHFFTTYDSVVYQGTWCPDCHIYISETICRRFFEKIFKVPFPKSYPIWLTNKNGNQMELDGYNKELGLAFEYQGIQHRKKAFNMTDDDLKNLQEEDALKLKLCKKNGVILLQIPDDEIIPYDKMQEYIEEEYKRKTEASLKDIPKYDYKEFIIYENKYAKKFRAYVEKKGGTLLTPYFSARKEVTLMCEKGHKWLTTPDSIYRNNWCSECAGNKKGSRDYFRKLGVKFNCELISDYVNARESLWYRCQNGHKFKRTPYWLKRSNKEIDILCPKCKRDYYAKRFQDFVNNKGGYLITPYKGRFKPLKIKCKNNHVWETTPGAIYQGGWCTSCKKNEKT
ncbi:MAG: hypothetical protein ACFFAF_03295 [Candidatus Hermodarchaeota archaeon]